MRDDALLREDGGRGDAAGDFAGADERALSVADDDVLRDQIEREVARRVVDEHEALLRALPFAAAQRNDRGRDGERAVGGRVHAGCGEKHQYDGERGFDGGAHQHVSFSSS